MTACPDTAYGATSTAWRQWTGTATTTTAVTTNGSPWGYWAAEGGTAATTAWHTWMSESTTSGAYTITQAQVDQAWGVWREQVEVRQLTRAEKKAQRKKQAELEAAARVRQAEAERVLKAGEEKRKKAAQRAEALLLSHLSDEQEKAWREERAIFVTSQSGKRFKIKEGRAHNIFELGPDGVPIREYCVHVGDNVPNADNVLAQKLALEHGEAALLRIANSWLMVNGARQ